MPVVMIQEPGEGFTPEMYDSVNEKVGIQGSPPEGLIVHTVFQGDGGRWQMVDVWESREAHDRFAQERLRPAVEATMREHGIDPEAAPGPENRFYETYDVIAPAAAGATR